MKFISVFGRTGSMPRTNDSSLGSIGERLSLSGRPKWAVGIGLAIIVSALAALGIRFLLAGADLAPVVAIALAVVGGAGIAYWVIDQQPH